MTAGSTCRSLALTAAALLVASCNSIQDSSPEVNTAADNSAKSYRQWEESTREFADDLMAEAQRLQREGSGDDAVALADDALCLVLETPAGYLPEARYLVYLAEMIDEANEIEAALQPIDDEIEATEEFVLLPPIDLFPVDNVIAEAVVDSPLISHWNSIQLSSGFSKQWSPPANTTSVLPSVCHAPVRTCP